MSESGATKNLIDLPTELLLHIFKFLDSKEILILCETCTKIKDIIEDSDQLVNKLTLYVKYPKNVKSFVETMKNSTRPYRNLKLTRIGKHFGDLQIVPANIFESVASIKNLEVNWSGYHAASSHFLQAKMTESHIDPNDRTMRVEMIFRRDQDVAEVHYNSRNANGESDLIRDVQERANIIQRLRAEVKKFFVEEFVGILRSFIGIETLTFSNVTNLDVDNFEPLENLSSIRELSIRESDLYICSKLFKPCVNLTKLDVSDPFPGFLLNISQRDGFERFLISLENLKELTIYGIHSFFRENYPDIKFKLNSLKLTDVYFTNQESAEKFFASQNQLKTIDLHIKNEFSRYQHLIEDSIPTIRFESILKTSKLHEIIFLFKFNFFFSFSKQQAP